MIEIVFGESACGSLKIAQTYGKGKYRGSAVSIFMRHEDAFFIFLALFTPLLIAELSIMFRQIKIGPENEKQ